MTNLRNLKVDELKDIARGYNITGAWKMTKDKLIESILKNAELNGHTDMYCDTIEAAEAEEIIENIAEDVQNEPETVEADTSEPAEENATESESEAHAPKKPNLRIKEITYNGKTQSIKAWAAELNMPWPTLYDRINRNGWSVEEAMTIPLGQRRPH